MSAAVRADLAGLGDPLGGHRPDEGARAVSPSPLEEAILQIAQSERALDDVLRRDQRLHRSNVGHEPSRCVRCFLDGRL